MESNNILNLADCNTHSINDFLLLVRMGGSTGKSFPGLGIHFVNWFCQKNSLKLDSSPSQQPRTTQIPRFDLTTTKPIPEYVLKTTFEMSRWFTQLDAANQTIDVKLKQVKRLGFRVDVDMLETIFCQDNLCRVDDSVELLDTDLQFSISQKLSYDQNELKNGSIKTAIDQMYQNFHRFRSELPQFKLEIIAIKVENCDVCGDKEICIPYGFEKADQICEKFQADVTKISECDLLEQGRHTMPGSDLGMIL